MVSGPSSKGPQNLATGMAERSNKCSQLKMLIQHELLPSVGIREYQNPYVHQRFIGPLEFVGGRRSSSGGARGERVALSDDSQGLSSGDAQTARTRAVVSASLGWIWMWVIRFAMESSARQQDSEIGMFNKFCLYSPNFGCEDPWMEPTFSPT